MTNVFEGPWLLLLVALGVFMIVGTWRALVPDKNRWWQWCIPLGFALIGIGLDVFVATDQEKIKTVTRQLMKSIANEDVTLLTRIVAPDYQDGLHADREQLLKHTRSGLSKSPVKKTTLLSQTTESLEPRRAIIKINGSVLFEEQSMVASTYKAFVFVTCRIHLAKQSNRVWLIREIELVEVDKQPMTWGTVPGSVW